MKKILLAVLVCVFLISIVAATCQSPPPAPTLEPGIAPGAKTAVKSTWDSSGNLLFQDSSGNTIFTIDGNSRALVMASAATLNSNTSVAYTGEANRTSAQQAQRISDETGSGLLVFGTGPSLTTPTIATPYITGTILGNPGFGTITSASWQSTTSIGFQYLNLTRGETYIPGDSERTTVAVTHSLGTTPGQVILGWKTQPSSSSATTAYLFPSNIGATTFLINVSSALGNTTAPTISWLAIP